MTVHLQQVYCAGSAAYVHSCKKNVKIKINVKTWWKDLSITLRPWDLVCIKCMIMELQNPTIRTSQQRLLQLWTRPLHPSCRIMHRLQPLMGQQISVMPPHDLWCFFFTGCVQGSLSISQFMLFINRTTMMGCTLCNLEFQLGKFYRRIFLLDTPQTTCSKFSLIE